MENLGSNAVVQNKPVELVQKRIPGGVADASAKGKIRAQQFLRPGPRGLNLERTFRRADRLKVRRRPPQSGGAGDGSRKDEKHIQIFAEIVHRVRSGHACAIRKELHKILACEHQQRFPNRSSRDSESLRERHFVQSRSGHHPQPQYVFPQALVHVQRSPPPAVRSARIANPADQLSQLKFS